MIRYRVLKNVASATGAGRRRGQVITLSEPEAGPLVDAGILERVPTEVEAALDTLAQHKVGIVYFTETTEESMVEFTAAAKAAQVPVSRAANGPGKKRQQKAA